MNKEYLVKVSTYAKEKGVSVQTIYKQIAKGKLLMLKTMNEKTYTLAELISFGNYLLSEQRNNSVTNEQSKHLVGDWDIANWKTQKNTQE